MAHAIHDPIRRPSMCEPPIAQLATALGDLQDDFKLVQGLADFVQEELANLNPTTSNWRP